MVPFSRLTGVGILLTCMALGFLIAIIGVDRTPDTDEAGRLRGAGPSASHLSGSKEPSAASATQEATYRDVGSGDADAAAAEGDLDVLLFPEQEPLTHGFWGPDDEEKAQIRDEGLVWPEQKDESHGFWGPDTEEREQLAKLVAAGVWGKLAEAEGFSFSYEL